MGDATGISWTDATWNVTRGCRRTAAAGAKTSGCGDATGGGCYAERMAARFCGPGMPYEGLITLTKNGPRWSGATRFVADRLADPLRWKKPRRIFVDSMSDLFYDDFTNEQIAAVFGVMAASPRHTFQVLTKRAERMREWFKWIDGQRDVDGDTWVTSLREAICWLSGDDAARRSVEAAAVREHPWPLPNVWLGVSVEHQAAADERIPHLLATPAAVRFLSCEPLLGAIDLSRWIERIDHCSSCGATNTPQVADRCPECGDEGSLISTWGDAQKETYLAGDRYAQPFRDGCELSWVIAGCESGPGARRVDVAWFRSLRDQCAAAGVPFFLKQAVSPWPEMHSDPTYWVHPNVHERRDLVEGPASKRKAGGVIELPYLDGVQHAEFPEAR